MDYFKNLIYSLCGAGVITSIFQMIVSNSKVQKSVNIFLSMFVFLYTIIPIGNITSNFDWNSDMNFESNSYSDIYKNGYEVLIKNSIKNVCDEYNLSIIDINIDSNMDDNGYLIVKKIELRLNSDNKNNIIAKEIKDKFNFEVIFI